MILGTQINDMVG